MSAEYLEAKNKCVKNDIHRQSEQGEKDKILKAIEYGYSVDCFDGDNDERKRHIMEIIQELKIPELDYYYVPPYRNFGPDYGKIGVFYFGSYATRMRKIDNDRLCCTIL
jgi:hypothetical protein